MISLFMEIKQVIGCGVSMIMVRAAAAQGQPGRNGHASVLTRMRHRLRREDAGRRPTGAFRWSGSRWVGGVSGGRDHGGSAEFRVVGITVGLRSFGWSGSRWVGGVSVGGITVCL